MACPNNLRWLRFVPVKLQVVIPCLFALLGAWIGDRNVADFWNIYVAGGFFLGLPVGVWLQYMKRAAVHETQESMAQSPKPDASLHWLFRGFAPLLGALFAIAVTIVVCTFVATRFPDEQALEARVVGNDATEYCLQTQRDGVILPLGVLTCLVSASAFVVIFGKLLGLSQKEQTSFPSSTVRSPMDRIGRALGCGIFAFLMLVLAIVLLWGVVLQPTFLVRSVIVDGATVHLASALRSWTVQRKEIQAVEIVEPFARPGYTTFQMQIRGRFHPPFQTVDLTFQETDPRLRKARELLGDLKKSLLTQQ